MFTWGSKYLFGVSVAAFLGAFVYGLVSGGGLIGVISVGYKGGVGDHAGYAVLLSIGVASAALGVLNIIVRDGEVTSDDGAGALSVATPRSASYWGPMAAFGMACLVVGVAVERAFFILGIVILSVVLLEWVIQAWADRATGDAEVNSTIRDRVIGPLEVPLLATVGILVVVMGISRVLLAVSKTGSVVVASVVAALVFAAAIFLAKAKVSRSVISGVVALGALAVLAGGIVGAVVGEREIHHEGEGTTHEGDGTTHEGDTPVEGEGE